MHFNFLLKLFTPTISEMKDYQCYLRFNTVSRTEFKDLMMSWHYLFKNKYEVVTLFSSA